jgi:cyclopropane-fatty-acyl-phospholipid synthase
MLDPTLQYSCAYFSGTDDLAEAQQRKLDLICRKLGLRAGQRLLDIGCGWGGLAKFAATHYGCRVVGITLSREQQAYASHACAGLPVEIRLQDYRELAEPFDRIVSVGMMEHVGYKNYDAYLAAAARCLGEGGLFLCHTIGSTRSRVNSDPWLNRYIFPDSMLPSVAQVAAAAEGRFVIEDVHNFGAYYDRTLMAWSRNFTGAWPRFRERYGDRFGRMWRYYLESCAAAFRVRDIELFQFVLAKGGVPGGYTAVR